MKNKLYYMFAIGLISAFCACNRNEELTINQDVVFVGGTSIVDKTRTAFDLNSYTDGAAQMGFVWTNDDYIIVYDGTNVAQSSYIELFEGGKKAMFVVGGLKTEPGTQYEIFYGAPKARFNKTNNTYMVNVSPEQVQSAADNSDHIHTAATMGDCGFATATAESTNFSLKHLSCYYMVGLTKSAALTGSVKVSSVKVSANKSISAKDGSSGVRIDGATGALMQRDGGDTYLMGYGRQSYVNLTITNAIELSSTEKHYAYLVSAPLNNIPATGITFTVTYTVDGGEALTKTVTKTPSALVSGKVYRVSIEI